MRVLIVLSLIISATLIIFLGKTADAMFMSPYNQGAYQMVPQLNSFRGMPYYPGRAPQVNLGQIMYYQRAQEQQETALMMAASRRYNWTGSQPLGLGSYTPPIGLSNIINSSNYTDFRDRYVGYTGR